MNTDKSPRFPLRRTDVDLVVQANPADSQSHQIQKRQQSPVDAVEAYPERANLYRLDLSSTPDHLYLLATDQPRRREIVRFQPGDGVSVAPCTIINLKRALQHAILEHIDGKGFRSAALGKLRFSSIVDMTTNHAASLLPSKTTRGASAKPIPPLHMYSAYQPRVMYFGGVYYLCVNHHLMVRTMASLAMIQNKLADFRPERRQHVFVRDQNSWLSGRLVSVTGTNWDVELDSGTRQRISCDLLTLDLTREQVIQLAPLFGIPAAALDRHIKRVSFLAADDAPRARLDACTDFVHRLAAASFPIHLSDQLTLTLDDTPASLRPPQFDVGKDATEVDVAFDHVDRSKRSKNILTGLTQFGACDKPGTPVHLTLIAPEERMEDMERLVARLNTGSQRYPGAQRVFGGALVIRSRVAAEIARYEDEIRRLVRGPSGDEKDLALVYLPRTGRIHEPQHPYYRTKRLLVREGIVSQMVDEATVRNPEWRDLNLALNMFAKAGFAPWVLDEPIPGVDLFIGLSTSQIEQDGHIVRMMGYVNVFDSYGRWQFYQGDTVAFSFGERLAHYEELIKNSIATYQAQHGGRLQTVHIHLTKRFSTRERQVLARAVRAVAGVETIIFVWLDTEQPLRLYDVTPERQGYITRATYLRDGDNRLYLATTGNNIFHQKMMGTPVPIQATIWADPSTTLPTLSEIAQQLVSLTRLNWASSRNFCQEPITTKFAGAIARFMVNFVGDATFSVNPTLRDKPWFL